MYFCYEREKHLKKLCFMKKILIKRGGILLTLLLTLLLAGCGPSEELTDYKEKMERFFGVIALYDSNMNAIEPMAEDAEETLLHNLDNMETAFNEMAEYEIPEEFATLGELPKEAAFYMSAAVAKYHEAYDNEYNEAAEAEATQFYEKANRRLQYIIDILHGEIPEGGDVEFVEE